ncbi:MAG TPA: hypothetical protein VFE47_30215 [Tepidisphaeraceae bacterium]|jgi:hypothetical protein|nr:hypothetical protein [Tepidisphaeraceae bacterium]
MPSHATTTVLIALVGWIPLTIIFFALFSSRRAMLLGMIGGWLFLPVYVIKLKAVPEYSKLTAASYGVLLGTMIFDWERILHFKFRWFDIPMLCWCVTPFITSIENGLGWYDGVSAVIQNSVLWGLPYFLGRIYFPDWESFKELGIGIIIGGIIYIPLCLIEIRLSPQLHKMVYGFSQGAFNETKRMGGYRPMVFLQHGLAVGMWMNSATLCALWMWQTKAVKTLFTVPMIVWVGILFVTTVLCKSTAGMAFLAAGIGILYSIKFTRLPILLLGVIAVAPVYMTVRAYSIDEHKDEIAATVGGEHAVGEPLGEEAVALCLKLFGEERTQSFEVRVRSENQLAAHALEQPWFGWGRWNRNRVRDKMGKDAAPTDGLWVIALGVSGIVGLAAFTITILMAPLLIWYRCPLKYWDHPGTAAAVAMAVLLSLYMLDNILNAMPDPIFTVALGGLTGIAPSIRAQVKNIRTVQPRPVQAMPAMA